MVKSPFTFLASTLLAGLCLGGCTKAALPSVQALSTTLVQMKTTGLSPFDQTYDLQKYVVFSGECLSIITGLQISLGGSAWINVPAVNSGPINGPYTINGATYNYIETSTPPSAYDVNCADGSYYFFFYQHQVDELLFQYKGITPNTNSDVGTISIRGVSGAYTTAATTYTSNNGSGIPAQIFISKTAPSQGSLANVCAEIVIGLRSSDGRSATSSSAIPFSLSHSFNGTVNSFYLYSNNSDCVGALAPNQISPLALQIPVNKSEVRFFYPVPSGTPGFIHHFSVNYSNSPIALDTSNATLDFPIQTIARRYFDSDGTFMKVLAGACYPITLFPKTYDGISYSATSDTVTTTGSTDLEVFPTSSCLSPITFFTVSGTSKVIYVKLKATATGVGGVLSFSNVAYDSSPIYMEFDLSGDTVISKVQVRGPEMMPVSSYSNFTVSFYNSHGATLVAASSMNVSLNIDSPGKGQICSFLSSCTVVSSVTLGFGQARAQFSYNALLIGVATITPTYSVLPSYSATVNSY